MTIDAIQRLLKRASATTGTNVSLGIYANGGLFIDGHDCGGSIDDAVDWLEKLANDDPAPKLERARRTTIMPSRQVVPAA